jgi:hypothetical protein
MIEFNPMNRCDYPLQGKEVSIYQESSSSSSINKPPNFNFQDIDINQDPDFIKFIKLQPIVRDAMTYPNTSYPPHCKN